MKKTLRIGGILSNYVIKGPNENELLFKRCKYLLMKPKKKKAQKDFGHFILSLPTKEITKQEFETSLKKQKIKRLDKDLVGELENRYAFKKTKVNCPQMIKDYMDLYPDTVLPPPKPKKGKKGKKDKRGKEKEIAVIDFEAADTEQENVEEMKTATIQDNIEQENVEVQENIVQENVETQEDIEQDNVEIQEIIEQENAGLENVQQLENVNQESTEQEENIVSNETEQPEYEVQASDELNLPDELE